LNAYLEIPTNEALREALEQALRTLVAVDVGLIRRDAGERCLVARLMLHIQPLIPGWFVDVEFNRQGANQDPKRLGIDPNCAKKFDREGRALAIPDLIVHNRLPEGPNLMVVELKKSTNRMSRDCDRMRVNRFIEAMDYRCGASIEVESRPGRDPQATIEYWAETQANL
jgi:hypothetical protein